jgi:hypothetical protein
MGGIILDNEMGRTPVLAPSGYNARPKRLPAPFPGVVFKGK